MIGARVRPIPDQAVILDLNRMVRTFDWSVQIQTFQVYFEIVLFELFENSMEMLPEMMIAKLFFQKKIGIGIFNKKFWKFLVILKYHLVMGKVS